MPSPKPWPMGNEFHNLCRGFHEHHYHVFRFGVIGKFSKAYYKLTTWPYWSHPWAWTPDAGGHELHNFDRGLLGHHKHVFSFSHTCGLRERDFLKCCLFLHFGHADEVPGYIYLLCINMIYKFKMFGVFLHYVAKNIKEDVGTR